MRIRNVSGGKDTIFVGHMLLRIDDLDTSTAACCDRLQDVQCLFVLGQLPIRLKLLILLVQNEGHRRNGEVLRKLYPEAVHVSPKEIFAPQLGASREMIGLLILV